MKNDMTNYKKVLVHSLLLSSLFSPTLLALDLDIVKNDNQNEIGNLGESEKVASESEVVQLNSDKKSVWGLGLGFGFKEQDLSSGVSSTEIEERSKSVELIGTRSFECPKGYWELELSLGYRESDFDYGSGDAELNLSGWGSDVSIYFIPKMYQRLQLSAGFGIAKIDGRDYIDHTTGLTGLSRDAELEELSYSFEASYEVLSLSCPYASHDFRVHAGWEEREWDMNIGWTTNPKETMSVNNGGSLGLSYDLQFHCEKSNSGSVKFYGGIVDGGYDLNLRFGYDF